MRPIGTNETPSGDKELIGNLKWHCARVSVQISDTDYGGGVYHGRYFALFHQARDCFMEDLGVTTLALMQQGLDLTVAELHTAFLASVFYGDVLEIKTRILWLGKRSMGVAQEMFGTHPVTFETTLRNRTEINLVCTCNGKARPLPQDLVSAIRAYYNL